MFRGKTTRWHENHAIFDVDQIGHLLRQSKFITVPSLKKIFLQMVKTNRLRTPLRFTYILPKIHYPLFT